MKKSHIILIASHIFILLISVSVAEKRKLLDITKSGSSGSQATVSYSSRVVLTGSYLRGATLKVTERGSLKRTFTTRSASDGKFSVK